MLLLGYATHGAVPAALIFSMALPFRGLGLHPCSAFCLTLPCLSFPFVSAYSLAEVEQKTLEFRKEMTTPIPIAEDASEFEVITQCHAMLAGVGSLSLGAMVYLIGLLAALFVVNFA